MRGQSKHERKYVSFSWVKKLKKKKILKGTKDEVYLWSHRVVWNNGALDVAQTDGSLVYLYIHISQAWVLASKALGWETKSSHQSHTCVLVYAHEPTHTNTSHDLTLQGLFVQATAGLARPCMAHHNTQSSTDDNSLSGSSKTESNPVLRGVLMNWLEKWVMEWTIITCCRKLW